MQRGGSTVANGLLPTQSQARPGGPGGGGGNKAPAETQSHSQWRLLRAATAARFVPTRPARFAPLHLHHSLSNASFLPPARLAGKIRDHISSSQGSTRQREVHGDSGTQHDVRCGHRKRQSPMRARAVGGEDKGTRIGGGGCIEERKQLPGCLSSTDFDRLTRFHHTAIRSVFQATVSYTEMFQE